MTNDKKVLFPGKISQGRIRICTDLEDMHGSGHNTARPSHQNGNANVSTIEIVVSRTTSAFAFAAKWPFVSSR